MRSEYKDGGRVSALSDLYAGGYENRSGESVSFIGRGIVI